MAQQQQLLRGWRSACALLAVTASCLAVALAVPEAQLQHRQGHGVALFGRKLLQDNSTPINAGSLLPTSMTSCQWLENQYPQRCALTYAQVFAVGANWINSANYGARANAFVVAADLQCGTMTQESDCTWPCQWDNEGSCRLADQTRLTVWDCPSSPARIYYTCPNQPRLTKSWCLATQGCTYVPQPPTAPNTQGLRACESTQYVNMTPAQRLDFGGPSYYVRMPREQLGCCKGSTYRYTRNTLCRPGQLSQGDCNAISGCRWGTDGSCLPTPWELVRLQFTGYPRDPLNAQLQAMAKRCDAITSPGACNAQTPVSISPSKVMAYLSQSLDNYNTPIRPDRCVVPSANSPPPVPPPA